jgi:hypothetical protein
MRIIAQVNIALMMEAVRTAETTVHFNDTRRCIPEDSKLHTDNPTLEKTLVTKSEEVMTGYFSWQKLLRKTRAHVGLSSH